MLSRRTLFAALGLALPVASAEAATSKRRSTGKSHSGKASGSAKHATSAKPKRAQKADADTTPTRAG